MTAALLAAITTLAFPPPAVTNCPFEVSSCLPLAVDSNRLDTVAFELSFDATPSNNVEIAVGRDANGDGKLALLEADVTFGYDCGAWIVKETATGRVTSEPAPTEGRLARTIQFKRGKTYDPNWNMVKLTRRGLLPADGADTLNESVVMESHLRHFCIFIR